MNRVTLTPGSSSRALTGIEFDGDEVDWVPAALVLGDSSVTDCVTATAKAHGVAIHPADNDALDAAERRAAAIRAALGKSAALVSRSGTESVQGLSRFRD